MSASMLPLPMDPMIRTPVQMRSDAVLRVLSRGGSVVDLCVAARVESRVTGGSSTEIVLVDGDRHYRSPSTYYVGVGSLLVTRSTTMEKKMERALRVLEVLAHGFHDYTAREAVCGRGIFNGGPSRVGRPPIGGSAMTSAERMRRMRSANAERAK